MIETEYGIKNKLTSYVNPQESATIYIIHQVLGYLVQTYNLHETYLYYYDPCMGILSEAAFVVCSMYHLNNGKSLVQLVFGRYIILPINHIADWKYIHQNKQAQIGKKTNPRKNTRIGHDYRVGDQVMIRKHTAFKYNTPFKGPYENFQMCTNGTVKLQTGEATIRIKIRRMMTYHNITDTE